MTEYVHGYSEKGKLRLSEQAETLENLLLHDTMYPPGVKILEADCGIGAQTVILAKNNPEAEITSIDISRESLGKAIEKSRKKGVENIRFLQADIFSLPFEEESFHYVFVCFVLGHLPNPVEALEKLKSVLRPGGILSLKTITVHAISIQKEKRP